MKQEHKCQWQFDPEVADRIICTIHPREFEILRDESRAELLQLIVTSGEWKGALPPELHHQEQAEMDTLIVADCEQEEDVSHIEETIGGTMGSARSEPTVPGVMLHTEEVTFSVFGSPNKVHVNVKFFRKMLVPEATEAEAFFLIGWCRHNRVDPFAGEVDFSIMVAKKKVNGKEEWVRQPTPIVKAFAKRKRLQGHPDYEGMSQGVLVESTYTLIRAALLMGRADVYDLPEKTIALFIQATGDGKMQSPVGFPERFVVRKHGEFVDPDETLIGAWSHIRRKSNPHTRPYELSLAEWRKDTRFWKDTGMCAHMIVKTAGSQNIAMEFTDLAGIWAAREKSETAPIIQEEKAVDGQDHNALLRQLHAVGSQYTDKLGHDALHHIAKSRYEACSLTDLSHDQLKDFISLLDRALTHTGPDQKVALEIIKSYLSPRDQPQRIFPKLRRQRTDEERSELAGKNIT